MEWKFEKSFNNNAALVTDGKNREWIVVGSGVSFGKKNGDEILSEKVERFFQAHDGSSFGAEQLTAMSSLKDETLTVTTMINKTIEDKLQITFTNEQYLALADHLQFAIERAKENVVMNVTTLAWELQMLYPREYEVAKETTKLLETQYDIILPDSEIVFLTYHFVGAQNESGTMNETVKMTQLIQQTLEIVQRSTQKKIVKDDLNCTRFVTHLRFFILKKLNNEAFVESTIDNNLIHTLQEKYASAYEIAKKIGNFYTFQEQWEVTDDEVLYLTLHLWRLIR